LIFFFNFFQFFFGKLKKIWIEKNKFKKKKKKEGPN